jgi:hypothetical protein
MTKRRILYILHNHPTVAPGGAEQYSLELYESMRSNPDFEPLLLARGGPPSLNVPLHEGTALVNGDSNQYFLISSLDEYNSFFGSATHKRRYQNDLQKFPYGELIQPNANCSGPRHLRT